ncbi:hypothetical protein D3C80_1763760 [compost metagenome]
MPIVIHHRTPHVLQVREESFYLRDQLSRSRGTEVGDAVGKQQYHVLFHLDVMSTSVVKGVHRVVVGDDPVTWPNSDHMDIANVTNLKRIFSHVTLLIDVNRHNCPLARLRQAGSQRLKPVTILP